MSFQFFYSRYFCLGNRIGSKPPLQRSVGGNHGQFAKRSYLRQPVPPQHIVSQQNQRAGAPSRLPVRYGAIPIGVAVSMQYLFQDLIRTERGAKAYLELICKEHTKLYQFKRIFISCGIWDKDLYDVDIFLYLNGLFLCFKSHSTDFAFSRIFILYS